MDDRPIMIFDGDCAFCSKAVQFIIKRDPNSKFSFASLQSQTGRELLTKYDLPEDDLNTFVYIRDGKAYTKSTAGLLILKELGGGWGVISTFIIVPKALRDFFYDLLATSRYKIFGKQDTCMIPSPQIKNRFLE